MSISNMSMPLLLLGLIGLAAILFLLQRLRVRYRERTVITTLFWKQALEEARARVLVRRFKHPLAYLFVLLIGALLWIGYADLGFADDDGREHIILVDGSAGMGRGDRLDETLRLVKEHLDGLPRSRRRVIFCGGRPIPLLQPGEESVLLDARMPHPEAEACPATVDATLRTFAAERGAVFVIAGDAPISTTTRDMLSEHATVARLAPAENGDGTGDNAGIVALGVGPASSSAWEQIDVLCEVSGNRTIEASALGVSIGGRAVELKATRTVEGKRTRILLTDVPASGELLTIALSGEDDLTADDTATIRLPDRRRIRVALSPALDATLGPVLRADPAVLVTGDNADVAVRNRGEAVAPGIPALEFVPIAGQREAILLHHAEGQDSQTVLMESFTRLGLSEVDAMDVAQASGHTIAIGAAPASRRGIGVWAPLLSDRFNFVQSRSFPLFVAKSVRWLAEIEDEPGFVAAGTPLRGDNAARTDERKRRLDPVGADFVPPRAGIYVDAPTGAIAASLVDPMTTERIAGATLAPIDELELDTEIDALLWLAGLVLLLLMVEWFLFSTGRMP